MNRIRPEAQQREQRRHSGPKLPQGNTSGNDISRRIASVRAATAFAVLATFASCCAFGQTTLPEFETASVKANTSGNGSSPGSTSSVNTAKGRIEFTNVTLRQLIERAYSLRPFQLAGPVWLGNVGVDIVAKYPAETTNEQRTLMLQALLAERFHLAIHRESKEMSAYALVVAKNGPKLTEVQQSATATSNGRGRFQDRAISMAGLADQLARELERPVVDKTGLTAVYDLKLEWTPDDQPAGKSDGAPGAPPLGPSIFTALQEQLGLKLQTQKAPVEIVVVDHVDRAPVEN
jgi:uncharacterized protein (TIGR03435 family)